MRPPVSQISLFFSRSVFPHVGGGVTSTTTDPHCGGTAAHNHQRRSYEGWAGPRKLKSASRTKNKRGTQHGHSDTSWWHRWAAQARRLGPCGSNARIPGLRHKYRAGSLTPMAWWSKTPQQAGRGARSSDLNIPRAQLADSSISGRKRTKLRHKDPRQRHLRIHTCTPESSRPAAMPQKRRRIDTSRPESDARLAADAKLDHLRAVANRCNRQKVGAQRSALSVRFIDDRRRDVANGGLRVFATTTGTVHPQAESLARPSRSLGGALTSAILHLRCAKFKFKASQPLEVGLRVSPSADQRPASSASLRSPEAAKPSGGGCCAKFDSESLKSGWCAWEGRRGGARVAERPFSTAVVTRHRPRALLERERESHPSNLQRRDLKRPPCACGRARPGTERPERPRAPGIAEHPATRWALSLAGSQRRRRGGSVLCLCFCFDRRKWRYRRRVGTSRGPRPPPPRACVRAEREIRGDTEIEARAQRGFHKAVGLGGDGYTGKPRCTVMMGEGSCQRANIPQLLLRRRDGRHGVRESESSSVRVGRDSSRVRLAEQYPETPQHLERICSQSLGAYLERWRERECVGGGNSVIPVSVDGQRLDPIALVTVGYDGRTYGSALGSGKFARDLKARDIVSQYEFHGAQCLAHVTATSKRVRRELPPRQVGTELFPFAPGALVRWDVSRNLHSVHHVPHGDSVCRASSVVGRVCTGLVHHTVTWGGERPCGGSHTFIPDGAVTSAPLPEKRTIGSGIVEGTRHDTTGPSPDRRTGPGDVERGLEMDVRGRARGRRSSVRSGTHALGDRRRAGLVDLVRAGPIQLRTRPPKERGGPRLAMVRLALRLLGLRHTIDRRPTLQLWGNGDDPGGVGAHGREDAYSKPPRSTSEQCGEVSFGPSLTRHRGLGRWRRVVDSESSSTSAPVDAPDPRGAMTEMGTRLPIGGPPINEARGDRDRRGRPGIHLVAVPGHAERGSRRSRVLALALSSSPPPLPQAAQPHDAPGCAARDVRRHIRPPTPDRGRTFGNAYADSSQLRDHANPPMRAAMHLQTGRQAGMAGNPAREQRRHRPDPPPDTPTLTLILTATDGSPLTPPGRQLICPPPTPLNLPLSAALPAPLADSLEHSVLDGHAHRHAGTDDPRPNDVSPTHACHHGAGPPQAAPLPREGASLRHSSAPLHGRPPHTLRERARAPRGPSAATRPPLGIRDALTHVLAAGAILGLIMACGARRGLRVVRPATQANPGRDDLWEPPATAVRASPVRLELGSLPGCSLQPVIVHARRAGRRRRASMRLRALAMSEPARSMRAAVPTHDEQRRRSSVRTHPPTLPAAAAAARHAHAHASTSLAPAPGPPSPPHLNVTSRTLRIPTTTPRVPPHRLCILHPREDPRPRPRPRPYPRRGVLPTSTEEGPLSLRPTSPGNPPLPSPPLPLPSHSLPTPFPLPSHSLPTPLPPSTRPTASDDGTAGSARLLAPPVAHDRPLASSYCTSPPFLRALSTTMARVPGAERER
ncbi:hypothetical protein C8Q79DRAFT_930536 [Trametes meyenii]|nr:hypothetical protein C8Q79DRAFT_930536 [Trametes meyenii]